MGVPKFYRWISERYPCLSEVVKEHQIPEFDNLYLDMNGIIHQCSHPNDEDVHFRISEEKIFADIFHYLEVLFRIIKPRKVFFMAVDGVAPRAKMNQQRGRRFRSAKEAEEKIKKALDKGEVLPTEARFDSNCITPGTEFMVRLQEQLKYFVHNKLSTDKLWQNVKIYLSGHETPGEGEHKIMEFIRSETSKPLHDPNTRHCLYGLDADLIMLGLTSHEPNFSLLREEVRFGGKKSQKRVTAPEETTFHLLHLSLMREYINYEFSEAKNQSGSKYDLERIIDDWILMSFLVGNDFIPHLPHLHINHDALPLLYKTYISVLPSLDGYLNENGHLNLGNFEKYLEKLSEFDREHFSEVFVDLKWFESKVGNKYLNEAAGQAAEMEAASKRTHKEEDCSLPLVELTSPDIVTDGGKVPTVEDDEEEDDIFETEFRQYKRTYYMTKMGVDVVSDDFLSKQAKCYVEGIQWILHYYYHGVKSWSWFYPYHYAPFLSDIRNISELTLTFDFGKPFMPFQQLLAVLPAASMELLPECYRHLMTSETSPIIEYYPTDFGTDLNGKQQEWEAVVLIPFIDERCLLAAMESCNYKLTKEEKDRNNHTECALYTYDHEKDFTYLSTIPQLFPNIIHCHARKENIPMDAWQVPLNHIGRSVDRSALYFCGFPTLHHIKHKFSMKKSGVVVFQQSSRGDNMILEILPSQKEELDCKDVAEQVLGKSVFVNWPHLEEARIIAVTDGDTKFSLDEPSGVQRVYHSPSTPPPTKVTYLLDKEQRDWIKDIQGITEHYLKRKGITVNETTVVLYGQLLTGRKYVPKSNGVVELEKQWAKQVLPFAYQTVVQDIEAFYSPLTCFKSLEDLYPPQTTVFMVGNHHYYAAMGEVQDSSDVIKEGRVRVVFNLPHDPQLEVLIQNQHKYCVKYSPGYIVASRLGISGYLVSRFSGSIFIGRGSKKNPCGEQKGNVGLNLKFNKKNEEVPGYTKRTEKEWLYSAAVEELLAEYLERFPEVFDTVARNGHDDVFYEDDIWPGEDHNGAEKVAEIMTWLKNHPVSSISRASCDLQVLDVAIIEKIEEAVEKAKVKKSTKKVRVTVKPHLLFRPLEQQQGVVPDPNAEYRLFDRVINVRESFTVPLGLRGTVIGIKGAEREDEVLYEVLFDEEFAGGLNIRCTSPRCYRLPPCALLNQSHGARMDPMYNKLTAIVKPQPAAATNFNSHHHVASLNHSPRSPFISTQHNKHSEVRPAYQGSKNSKAAMQKQQDKSKDVYMNIWQSLQDSAPSHKPPAQWQNNPSAGVIKLLKKSEEGVSVVPQQNTVNKTSTEFEDLIASLKISKDSQQSPANLPPAPLQTTASQSDEPLSPQSFAMKGTMVLKEMLKIDGTATGSSAPQETANDQKQNKRGKSKKLAAQMNLPHGDKAQSSSPVPVTHVHQSNPLMASKVSELECVCVALGMAPPEFSFMHNRLGVAVCQVKLPNGLTLHGPQCQSENEAKEKAAFFALQRLNSLGSGFPLQPPLFHGVAHLQSPAIRAMPPVYNQPGGLMMPQRGCAPAPIWGMPLPPHPHPHHNPAFYRAAGTFPGVSRPQPVNTLPMGSHHQFIPLQVTKKRMSTNKKPQEFYSAAQNVARNKARRGQDTPPGQSQPVREDDPAPANTLPVTMTHPSTPPRQNRPAAGHTPGSASKRKHRKLAVNFEAARVSDQ
ncbi:5'-3' exoribonuclease 1 isoform X1 [Syngnathus acus]|uniref:5'-3' exoribonuclease 1 isoform X1 n=1 Tax=Syngnathus acus TaxID=161584 RepID=UPI001885ECB2|nr:5'-3' exoribonuclease 1 isoform X1 [Syngnathus acus]